MIKLGSGKFCPKCELEKVKVELKLLPNELLACQRCQTVYRIVESQLVQAVL